MDLLKPSSTLLEARSRLAASLRLTTPAAISRDAAHKIRQALSTRSPKARAQVASILRGLRLLQLPKLSSQLQSPIQPLRLPLHAKLHAMLRLGDLEGIRLSLQKMMKDGYCVHFTSATIAFSALADPTHKNSYCLHEFRNKPGWKPPQMRKGRVFSMLWYMQFVRDISPKKHTMIMRDLVIKRYLVLTARIFYDMLRQDTPRIRQGDIDVFVALANVAGAMARSPIERDRISGEYTLVMVAHMLEQGMLPFRRFDRLIRTLFDFSYAEGESTAGVKTYCCAMLISYVDKLGKSPIPLSAWPDARTSKSLLHCIVNYWQDAAATWTVIRHVALWGNAVALPYKVFTESLCKKLTGGKLDEKFVKEFREFMPGRVIGRPDGKKVVQRTIKDTLGKARTQIIPYDVFVRTHPEVVHKLLEGP